MYENPFLYSFIVTLRVLMLYVHHPNVKHVRSYK